MTSDPVVRSPLPDVTIPSDTVHGLLDRHADAHPDTVACIDATTGRTVSYSELVEATEGVASSLVERGLRRGDVVAIVAPNSIEWLITALGTMRAGGTITGANPGATVNELVHQLADAGARYVATTVERGELVQRAVSKVATVEWTIVLDDPSFDGLVNHGLPPAAVEVDLDEVCALPYSSGTTGRSKGVQLTHRTLVANISQVRSLAPIDEGDRVLAFLPMFHIMGFAVVVLAGLTKGATLVMLPGFEPRPFLSALQEYHVRSLFVVPPIANFLASHPLVDEFDLSSVEMLGCGAAPLGAELERRLEQRIGCRVRQGYGMTESSGCISYPLFDQHSRPGASSVLLPNTEGLIVDPATGHAVPVGATGEIWFRGPQVFTGYLHNEEATAATIDAEGWVHTGDLGHFDRDGFLSITDRLKELIKVKGFQVAPAELEALLIGHPDVSDVAVIGRPDGRSGEVPVAYVVVGGRAEVDGIKAWANEQVSDYKRLAQVIVTDSIPKNPSGKILRRVLRQMDHGSLG